MRLPALAIVATAALACGPAPTIKSFTADRPSIVAGESVTLSWSVQGATSLTLSPEPGGVTGQDHVTVSPAVDTTYELQAMNDGGSARASLSIAVTPAPRTAIINSFVASPGVIATGQTLTLRWSVSNAATIQVFRGDGTSVPCPKDNCLGTTQTTDAPRAPTIYKLVVTGKDGTDAPAPATTIVRIGTPPVISGFQATPSSVAVGDPVVLSWGGDAVTWTVSDGTHTYVAGAARSMVVYPLAPVTYTLTGTSVSGITAAAQSQVAVSGNAGSSLVYEPPSDPTRALQLVADACPAPCTRLTFRIVRGAAASVRGIALDLPFNPTRIALPDPPAFNVRPGAAGGIARGSAAPLRDMLVVGAGMKQAAGQPPVEVTDAPGELANFDVLLVPGAGPGVVFDGSPAPDGRLPIVDVRGSSLAAGGIAIGKLRVVE